MSIKLVIFDMDGLMFDTERIAGKCFKEAAKYYGYEVSNEIRLSLLGCNKEACKAILVKHFGNDYPSEKINILSAQKKKAYISENGVPCKKGLKALLEYLKGKGFKIAVASSSNHSTVTYYLELSKTRKYIDYIITGDQVKESKPHPEIFLSCCNHFEILPEQSLVLEDSKNGILAAYSCNIPVICIPDLVRYEKEIEDLTIKTANSLYDVINYMEKLNS